MHYSLLEPQVDSRLTRGAFVPRRDEYDEEDIQFFDAHDDASHDVEGYEESGDPMYYNDDWSMTYDGTDHSLSMIRLGSVGISDKPTPIHHLEKPGLTHKTCDLPSIDRLCDSQ